MAKPKGKRTGRTRKKAGTKARKQNVQLELDMIDHISRLRSIPSPSQDALRQALLWIAVGVLLLALGWLAVGR